MPVRAVGLSQPAPSMRVDVVVRPHRPGRSRSCDVDSSSTEAIVVAAALATYGVVTLLGVVRRRRTTSAGETAGGRPGSTTRSGWIVGGLAALVLLVAVVVAIDRSSGHAVAETVSDPRCNGSVLLCERSLREVAIAATHNSMAAAEDGFVQGSQTEGIVPQLEAGFRGLLIDVYFGLATDDVVITDRAPLTEAGRAELVGDVGEAAVRSAEAISARAVEEGIEPQLFLCHAFCELGAVRFVDELSRIDAFLDERPREVVVMVIQDEGPTDDDVAAAFETSGLIDRVHVQPLDGPWPTLGDMIEQDRLVLVLVLAENDAGDTDWYHDAFTFIRDTPFRFESPEEFTCELNRGSDQSPLLLVNHWLSPVSPTAADVVNDGAVLRARLAECDDVGFPNLVAVDFADRGDLLTVIDELNGLRRPAP